MKGIAAWLTRLVVFLLALAALAPEPALAWGGQGHRIVARLAMRQIRREAATDADARRVRTMVYQAIASEPGVTLESASVFPDTVRRKEPYTYADNWHFVSIPRAESDYDAAVQCKIKDTAPDGDCAVGGLAYFRKIVLEQEGAPNKETLDALSFIIHIIGDLHQPLHTSEDLSFIHDGKPGDRGGNFRQVCFLRASQSGCTQVYDGEREPKNLHSVWDKLMIIQTGKSEHDYVDELDERIRGLDEATLSTYMAGGPAEWAEDAHALAVKAAYTSPLLSETDLPHSRRYDDYFYVDAAYQDANIERVDEQLVKAAVRLAAYLKGIAHDLN
jgi:nuclease S1